MGVTWRCSRIAFKKVVRKLVMGALLVLGSVFLVPACCAQSHSQPGAKPNPGASRRALLKAFLKDHVWDPDYDYKGTRYFAAFVDLRDDGIQQAIVYFTDRFSCGSGGCTTLILEPEGSSYKVVTSISIARTPIRVLKSKSNGWHDISVVARINGIEPTYEAVLSFDGKTYPSNPTVPPARRLIEDVSGKIVVPQKVEGEPSILEKIWRGNEPNSLLLDRERHQAAEGLK